MRKQLIFLKWMLCITIIACHQKESTEEETKTEEVRTPVTVTTISNEPLTEYIELNATSIFQQDNIVKSNITGYIKKVNTKLNEFTNAGKVLFVLQTKESKSLGNTIDKLDPSYHFTGIVSVPASRSGYVTELNHQAGDYVQDGEQLAVISDANSFGFVLNLPYELHKYLSGNKNVDVILPDGTVLKGVLSQFMPTVDSISQTQQVFVKVNSSQLIPENLVAKVRILKDAKTNATSLPKEAVLSDESQSSFWVMKMIDSVTAVKVPVIKGMETKDRVEIVRPQFTTGDKILLTGNYGLADTAKVKIMKSEQ
jgi:multidrug efflux pump subunit AcrA (membrane-fusion protein)